MSLNCKQGDLAFVVFSTAGNEGRIVRCLELDPAKSFNWVDGSIRTLAAWRTDPPMKAWTGKLEHYAPDSFLRPIRNPDDDAVDEMVAKLGPAPMTLTDLREWSEVNHD